MANIWCSRLIRDQFSHETYITGHDVTLHMRGEFMQQHGMCQAQFEISHMEFKAHVLLTTAPYTTTFGCIIEPVMENVERGGKKIGKTHACTPFKVLTRSQISHTHLDNCAHHAPSGSHHSMCTCNFLGCWCTRGRSRHCTQSHTRRHLQGGGKQKDVSASEQEGMSTYPCWNIQ